MKIRGHKTRTLETRTAERLLDLSPGMAKPRLIADYFGEPGLNWRRRAFEEDGEEERFSTWEIPEDDLLELIATMERLTNEIVELKLDTQRKVNQVDPVVRKRQRRKT